MSKASDSGFIYLIHFDRPLAHAKHYLGWTEDIPARIRTHRKGRGARLLAVLKREKIGWQVARIWSDKTKKDERKAKKCRAAKSSICPICRGLAPDVPEEFREFLASEVDAKISME